MPAQAVGGGCLARKLLRIQHRLRPLWGVSGSRQSRRLPSTLVRASVRSFVADGDEAMLLDRFWQVQAQSLTTLCSSEHSCLLTKQQLRRLQARGVHDVEQRRRLIDAVAQSAEKGGASARSALAPLLLCHRLRSVRLQGGQGGTSRRSSCPAPTRPGCWTASSTHSCRCSWSAQYLSVTLGGPLSGPHCPVCTGCARDTGPATPRACRQVEEVSAWVLQMQSLLGSPADADVVKMVVREPRCATRRRPHAALLARLQGNSNTRGARHGARAAAWARRLLSADMRQVANRLLDMKVRPVHQGV